MRKLPTGKPCAGKPHARFGGRGEPSGSFLPLSAFPLQTALVKDPGVYDDVSYGSFFIFRKLEQFVRGFKKREVEIAEILSLEGEKSELAGAMIVGRFEDGTPVTMSDEARKLKPPNDFNYAGDPGSRCPFHAHIRKVNPRGSSGTEERSHIMARRGIPFEDKPRSADFEEFPESVQADILAFF